MHWLNIKNQKLPKRENKNRDEVSETKEEEVAMEVNPRFLTDSVRPCSGRTSRRRQPRKRPTASPTYRADACAQRAVGRLVSGFATRTFLLRADAEAAVSSRVAPPGRGGASQEGVSLLEKWAGAFVCRYMAVGGGSSTSPFPFCSQRQASMTMMQHGQRGDALIAFMTFDPVPIIYRKGNNLI